jgi:hypothetical protein
MTSERRIGVRSKLRAATMHHPCMKIEIVVVNQSRAEQSRGSRAEQSDVEV